MSRIKLILSDIDGCLCGDIFDLDQLRIIRNYCQKVQQDKNLARLSFVTGRGGEYVDCLVRVLNAFTPENFPCIVENGSFLFKPRGRIYIPHYALSGKEELISRAREMVVPLVKKGRARFIEGKSASISLMPVKPDATTEKLAKEIIALFQRDFLKKLFIAFSTTAVDITVAGIDKGSCLKFLCKKERILIDEVLAIGDSQGDIPILKIAGAPTCPANATEEVKHLVRKRNGYVAKNSFAFGVVEILLKHDFVKPEGRTR